MENTNVLTEAEFRKLERCEKVITQGRAVWQAVGKALLEIKKGRLYRATHPTWSAYCQERLNKSARQADRLCEGLLPVMTLEAAGETNCSEIREGQARELAQVPPGNVVEIFRSAKELAGGTLPTAKQIREVVLAHGAGADAVLAHGHVAAAQPPQAPDFGKKLFWLDTRIDELMAQASDLMDFDALATDLEIKAEAARQEYLKRKNAQVAA